MLYYNAIIGDATMKMSVFSAKPYEIQLFEPVFAKSGIDLCFHKEPLNVETAVLANHSEAVCCFVTDKADEACIQALSAQGVKLIALRSSGFDHVDLAAAKQADITVVHVPAYSPAAVAEFAVGLLLSVTRKIHHAHSRIKHQNFSLQGQVGSNLRGKTVGVIGTGNIGKLFCQIMLGFGCEVLASDPKPDHNLKSAGVYYTDLQQLFRESDVISLHCPLAEETKHIINRQSLSIMKSNAIIINTGRGALIDTTALIQALSHQQIAGCGLDVYENEHQLFFQDLTDKTINDPLWHDLQKFENVLITGHQAYLTHEALEGITQTTLENCLAFNRGNPVNEVTTS